VGTPPPPEKDAHPDRGTLGTRGRSDRMFLSADQLHDNEDESSWRAPHEKHGISNAALIAIIVLVAVVSLLTLRADGVI
jgi:hypothetical protein